MTPLCSLRRALDDRRLLGASIAGPTWANWRTLLLAICGEELSPAEREVFGRLTGRQVSPSQRARQAWIVAGRRGGKSRAAGVLAAYFGALCKYPMLAPGEKGVILCVAPDVRQANGILNYALGAIESSPTLAKSIVRTTADTIELKGNIFIEVRSSSFRRLRGFTLLCALLDEVAFFMADDLSSNPDTEIINAVKPALLTTGGLLAAFSSPYARKGVLFENYANHFGVDGDPILVAQAPSRVMNPSLDQAEIDAEYAKDPQYASAEYGAEFRTDIQSFVSDAVIDACTDDVGERQFQTGVAYTAFVDMSGGSSDSAALAIAHMEGGNATLDLIRERQSPHSPAEVTEEFAGILKAWGLRSCRGDRYAGKWPAQEFDLHGITLELPVIQEKGKDGSMVEKVQAKSDLYQSLLSMLNSRTVALLQQDRLRRQLLGLERRTGRGGKDVIDHGRGQHDDVANAAAGALVMAKHTPPSTALARFRQPINYPNERVA
jgi:hypothetical protein